MKKHVSLALTAALCVFFSSAWLSCEKASTEKTEVVQKVQKDPVEIPAWASNMSDIPAMNPPFEHAMAAGDVLRIPIEPGKSLKIQADVARGAKATAKLIPFKGGAPLGDVSKYMNFARRGIKPHPQELTRAEADDYVVRVEEGDITLITSSLDRTEKEVGRGEEFRFGITGNNKIVMNFVNVGEGKAEATYDFFKQGRKMGDDEAGSSAKLRKVSLDEEKRSWQFKREAAGDELRIKVTKGKMLIKLGEIDLFKF